MQISENPDAETGLKRALGPFHLITLGIGAIIGAGIFVLTGHAAAQFAGPGVVISFAIAGLGCLFAGLCYSEYASMIPVAGSAYTYTYATLGRFLAWIIGWNLVLEYLATSATVAVGWSGYFGNFLASFGLSVPHAFAAAPITAAAGGHMMMTGALFNLPAMLLVGFVTIFLVIGVKTSANFNNVMVAVKLAIVLAVIFFAYIGFDAVSVAAQEAKNPQRDVPIGILGSLLLCTALYMLMSYVLTGIAPYASLNVAHPVSAALEALPGTAWLAPYVNIGAIVGLSSVVLVLLLGQTRIFYAMSRDGVIPPAFAEIHPRFATPWKGTIITGIACAAMAGLLPLDILGELVSIGTLAAFVIVCAGVMVLRVRAPNAARPFRTPLVWITAPLGIAMCLFMMVFLPLDTWLRLAAWTAIGLAIYYLYSVRHAKPSRYVIAAE